MNNSHGSEWRRWDLHLHTASSYDADYKGKDVDDLLVATLRKQEIVAVAITDHFIIDMDRIKSIKTKVPEITVFPGVELRTDKGAANIHVILIFPDSIDLDTLSRDFSVIMLGDKAKNNGDNDRIYWDYKDIVEFAEKRDALISVHTGKKDRGLDKEITNALEVGQAIKEEYAKTAHIFEIGQVNDIESYKTKVFPKIKKTKPLVLCSDNHDPRKYNPDNYLWIKAEPTFNGLKQIIFEPEERVYISPTKPETKPEYFVIDKIEFSDDEFQTEPIFLSDKLNCIIGGKSTGKSILLHNLALTLDRKQVDEKDEVSKTRTKKDLKMTVYWADGKGGKNNPASDRKIIYIPQTYLNRLCDEYAERTEIDEIIQNIVLVNMEAQKAFDLQNIEIKNYKPELEKTILDLLELHNDIIEIQANIKDIGDKEGIEVEQKKLITEKERLTKSSSLKEEELKNYEDAITQIATCERRLNEIKYDIEIVTTLTSLIMPRQYSSSCSEQTNKEILSIQQEIITEADSKWKVKQKELLIKLEEQKNLIIEEQTKYKKIEAGLKDKIQSNKAIAEYTEKIKLEKDKLIKIEDLSKQENQKNKEKIAFIDKVVESIILYREYHQKFANTINNNADLKTADLEFSVEVRLRCTAFVDELKNLIKNNDIVFKEVISPDSFTSADYTKDKIKDIIENILSKKLPLVRNNTPETALREILSDWYEVKYIVKMGSDYIDTMSPGKKALVLLKLLIELAESTCPILIDQPEDDLDNRSVFDELIPFIKKKKKDRQIIVVTHNANIVLGADAEQVIVANQCGNNTPNKEKRFEYRTGAIENDVPMRDETGQIVDGILNKQGIQQHICDVLEGGEKAFELRKDKYHI